MSDNAGLLFGIASPYLVDHILPIKTSVAQFNFDEEVQALEYRQARQRNNLRTTAWRKLNKVLDRAEDTVVWSSGDALSGQLKTKGQLEAEKLAENLAARKAEEADEADVSEDD